MTLENLLFPEIKQIPKDIISKYPKRPVWQVVTRIAPSPTWFFHIGTLYTTMVDEIFACKNSWVLFLRAEDTDQKREIAWAMKKYIDIFKIFWIDFDEWPIWLNYEDVGNYGPYTQSQRKYIYKVFLKDLVAKGFAYPCFLTEEEITEIRAIQEASKVPTWIYGEYSKWRNASLKEVKKEIDAGKEFVIRYKSQWNIVKKIQVHDLIKWDVSIAENFLDIVIMKVNWLPTYHFAHIVDDYLMGTTLVIRWDEWFSSLPLHLQLFQTMGWQAPKYAHISPLMKIDWNSRRKLSKRKDIEANVEYYFKDGYLVEAIKDFLCNMINAWFEDWRALNPEKNYKEFDFKLEKMSQAGALVDIDKLKWVNSNVIKNMSLEKLYKKLEKYLETYQNDFYKNIFLKNDKKYNEKIILELKTRLVTLKDYKELTTFFYSDFEITQKIKDLLVNPKMKIEDISIAKKWLEIALNILKNKSWEFESVEEIKNIFVEKIRNVWMKNGQVLWPVRVTLSWEEFSPGALELIFILWIKKSIKRVENILKLI